MERVEGDKGRASAGGLMILNREVPQLIAEARSAATAVGSPLLPCARPSIPPLAIAPTYTKATRQHPPT